MKTQFLICVPTLCFFFSCVNHFISLGLNFHYNLAKFPCKNLLCKDILKTTNCYTKHCIITFLKCLDGYNLNINILSCYFKCLVNWGCSSPYQLSPSHLPNSWLKWPLTCLSLCITHPCSGPSADNVWRLLAPIVLAWKRWMGSLCRPHLFCAQYLVIISSIANPETDEVHLLQTEIVLHYPGMAVTRGPE